MKNALVINKHADVIIANMPLHR